MKALTCLVPLLTGCASVPPTGDVVPVVDYHQHLVSPAFQPIVKLPERDGSALLEELDAAGISKAVVHSVGYSLADERKELADPDRLTREENDWTSREVVRHAPRLVGFCSSNPLRPDALAELERCLALPGMKGIKLHFGNSGVTLRDPLHLTTMQRVFALAQRQHAPVLVHMRARGGINFGAEDARILLDRLAPYASRCEIVVAHLGSAGPGYPEQADAVMAVFGEAATAGHPSMRRLYFDVATTVTADFTPAAGGLVAKRLRQIGLKRVLYGSDLTPPGGSIRAGWEIFQSKVPLTNAELRAIASNRTSFVR